MSWRDDLQPGSFRGVPFLIDDSTAQVGRRVALHEYPLRDTPWGEDLGRRARRFAVDCLVLGTDYMSARDALIAALETAGAGTLVHPYFGTRSVVVSDAVEVRESTREGGVARFRIPFAESGEKLEPASVTDTPSVVNAASASAQAQLAASFANGQYSVSGWPAWLGASAMTDLNTFNQQLMALRDSIPSLPSAVTAFNGLLSNFSATLTSLVSTPFDLGAGVVSLVLGLGTLARQPLDALSLYTQLQGFGASWSNPAPATPARAQQAANRTALVTLVQGLALAQAAATSAQVPAQTQAAPLPVASAAAPVWTVPVVSPITGLPLPSAPQLVAPQTADSQQLAAPATVQGYDTAQAAAQVRESITEAIDTACLTADDPSYLQWRDLRAGVVADLSARAAALPSLVSFVPATTLPALVLAWRLFGDATRDAEIVSRNDVPYPGFVPGGQALEVLSV